MKATISRNTFLQKPCENLDAINARSAAAAASIAVEQEVIVTAIKIALFRIACFCYTSTPTRVQSNPSSKLALRHKTR